MKLNDKLAEKHFPITRSKVWGQEDFFKEMDTSIWVLIPRRHIQRFFQSVYIKRTWHPLASN